MWPILARYAIAVTAGATWAAYPLPARALWVVVLLSLVVYDVHAWLRRERETEARARLAKLADGRMSDPVRGRIEYQDESGQTVKARICHVTSREAGKNAYLTQQGDAVDGHPVGA